MPHFLLKQSGNLPCLLRLPDEILEEIFSELDQHADLVSFALASRMCSALVIPHHTQYRILRVRQTLPDMWAHLARRSDLARNVREVHICDEKSKWPPARYPTTLIDQHLDRDLENAEESVRKRNLCRALDHMHQLHTLTWSRNSSTGQRPTSHPAHENDILSAISRRPQLKHVSLSGKFAMHALNSSLDPQSLTYPLWMLSNLKSLSLNGESWANLGNSKHLWHLLAKSPNLECLEVPMEFHHLSECRLPKLRKLTLQLQAGVVNMAIDRSRTLFLENHPSIEELVWSPLGIPRIALDALPNLKSLQTNNCLITALNDADSGVNSVGLMTPPSTPVTTTTPVPDEPTPAPPRTLRPIESLSVDCLPDRKYLEANFIQPESLRALQLSVIEDFAIVGEIAEMFPNIEWLSLPAYHTPSCSPALITKEQWLDSLPKFKNLQVFRGLGLWRAANNDRQEMHEIIMELVHTCPQLRALDRINKYDVLDPCNEIAISRDGDHVRYSIKMVRRGPFDTMQRRL